MILIFGHTTQHYIELYLSQYQPEEDVNQERQEQSQQTHTQPSITKAFQRHIKYDNIYIYHLNATCHCSIFVILIVILCIHYLKAMHYHL